VGIKQVVKLSIYKRFSYLSINITFTNMSSPQADTGRIYGPGSGLLELPRLYGGGDIDDIKADLRDIERQLDDIERLLR
jgi:hypothetical protein